MNKYNSYGYANQKEDDEDDFVVSDMSAIERPSLFGFKPIGDWKRPKFKTEEPVDMTYQSSNPEPISLSKEETRWYILGVLKASLLIGSVYVVGLISVIILLLFLTK
jgi:hypothetical protein